MHTVKLQTPNSKLQTNSNYQNPKSLGFGVPSQWLGRSNLNGIWDLEFGHYNYSRSKGFTIPEVIVATAVALLLSGGVFLFFARQPGQFATALSALAEQRQGERALRLMTRELRGASQGADFSAPLRETQPNTLTFTTDVDADGIAELVSYTATGTTLTRNLTEPNGQRYPNMPTSTSTLATGITTTNVFRYPTPSIVDITLQLGSTKLEGTVLLRNLR